MMLNFLICCCFNDGNDMGNLLCIVREPAKADNLIGYVARLARELKSHVHIVYVEEEYEYTIGRPPAPEDYTAEEQSKKLNQARLVLSERIETVLGELRNEVSIDYSAELSSLIQAVHDYVNRSRPDMMILETSEPKGLMFGNTSNEELIDKVSCPVLLVPRDIVFWPIKQIVYATAYNEKDVFAVRDLLRITAELNPSIKILHVNTDAGSGEQMSSLDFADAIRKQAGNSNISLENLSADNNESVTDIINDYTSTVNADLLVVLKDEKKFFESLFNPDRTKKIVKKTDLPVLIYKI